MKDIVDIIMQINGQLLSGTKSDRRLAGVILSDLGFASQCAIADLAARADVSEPTVTRFCRRLGCDGMKEFKFRLAQAMAVGGQYLTRTDRNGQSQSRTADLVLAKAKDAMDRAFSALPLPLLDDSARRIIAADQILAFGSGGTSSMLAVELQNRLFRLGLKVTAYTDGQLQRMAAAVVSPQTVVIVCSISGFVQSVVDATAMARHYGAYTLAITAPGTALAGEADEIIPFQAIEDGYVLKPSASRYALLGIIDVLATTVADQMGPQVLEPLRRVKHSLNRLKVDNPELPLGD